MPTFSSTHPLMLPFYAIDFAIYSQLARQVVLGNMSWEITVDQWIRGLPGAGVGGAHRQPHAEREADDPPCAPPQERRRLSGRERSVQ
jgi:hypothetical protein